MATALQERATRALEYANLRALHPSVPAIKLWHYVRDGEGEPLREFLCPGHRWAYTGSAYGGDDDRWHGEGRCYCVNCGADGDA